jgi:hypothetical protein
MTVTMRGFLVKSASVLTQVALLTGRMTAKVLGEVRPSTLTIAEWGLGARAR